VRHIEGRGALAGRLRFRYGYLITKPPRRVNELAPVARPAALDGYVGKWVAVKEGRVVASADTGPKLVAKVKALGEEGVDAVAEYVAPASDSWMVGVG
jgi:hypothetical protein